MAQVEHKWRDIEIFWHCPECGAKNWDNPTFTAAPICSDCDLSVEWDEITDRPLCTCIMAEQLARLKFSAEQAAQWRGHTLSEWRDFVHREGVSIAKCTVCGAEAHVKVEPMPNEIDVSGEAVALNCPI